MTTKAPRPEDVKVGQRIRAARLLKGLSQEKLGEALGVTFQQVQKYEKGTNRIGASRMIQIAQLLGTSVALLVGETGGGHDMLQMPIMVSPLGQRLAAAFERITEHASREAVVRIAETIAAAADEVVTPRIDLNPVLREEARLS